jgi:hypothetical protein
VEDLRATAKCALAVLDQRRIPSNKKAANIPAQNNLTGSPPL